MKYMSKRSLFWGNASGKLGETVQYRAGGEQRARTYVKKIKNPRTIAQMQQRIPMANMNAVFKSIRSVVKESFPNRKSNQSGWNAFIQANKDIVKRAVRKEDAAMLGCAPFYLFVSNGDLPFNTTMDIAQSWNDPEAAQGLYYNMPIFDYINTDIPLATGEEASSPLTTAGKLYDYLTSSGNPLGLPSKFKITFIYGDYGAIHEINSCWGLNVAQIECEHGSTKGFKWYRNLNGSVAPVEFSPARGGTRDNEDNPTALVNARGLQLYWNATDDFRNSGVYAIIISWSEDGKIRCNRTQLFVPSERANVYQERFKPFMPGGAIWNDVLEQYSATGETDLGTTKNVAVDDAGKGFDEE